VWPLDRTHIALHESISTARQAKAGLQGSLRLMYERHNKLSVFSLHYNAHKKCVQFWRDLVT